MGRKASKSAKKKGGGLLTGMRTGFQKSARAVTGIASDSGGKQKSKKQPWWSTVLTLLLVAAIIVWLLYRRGVIK